jgi:hypothetical protein
MVPRLAPLSSADFASRLAAAKLAAAAALSAAEADARLAPRDLDRRRREESAAAALAAKVCVAPRLQPYISTPPG